MGAVNETAALRLTFNMLSIKLLSMRKMKVYSLPTGRCLKATLWICYDTTFINKGKLSGSIMESEQHLRGIQIQTPHSKDTPTVVERSRQHFQTDSDGDKLSSLRSTLSLHRMERRAAVAHSSSNSASTTTPRSGACKYTIQVHVHGTFVSC